MKFTHLHPFIDILSPSPLLESANKFYRVRVNQTPTPVPLSRFLTASMVYSSAKFASLLRLATNHRIYFVFRVPPPELSNRIIVTVLKIGFHTLLRIPLVNSVLCLHSLYLLDICTRIHADTFSI